MKITYKEIYSFNVDDALACGREVHVLDKSNGTSEVINDMTIRRALEIIDKARASDRYYFWTIETEED